MKFVLLLCLSLFVPPSLDYTIDFKTAKHFSDWEIINDGVMGGLSEGQVHYGEQGLRFSGNVSLRNNGGFTSYKSPFGTYNFSPYSTLEIRYRSKGAAVAFQIENVRGWWEPCWKANLPVSEDWTTLRVKLTDMKEYQLGGSTGLTLTKDVLSEIVRYGFITNEKKETDFEIEVEYVRFR